MVQSNKTLILGGSGYLGKHLFTTVGQQKSIATYNNVPIPMGVHFNALTMDVAEIIDDPASISHAVILLGDTKPESCAADIVRSTALNVESIKQILGYLKIWNIKPIFASTEIVFDGTKGDYIESDQVNPIVTYGKQKVEVEQYLEDNFENYLVVRLSLIYGSEKGDGTILTSWLHSILQKEQSYCAYDYISSPICIEDAVQGIIRLIDVGANGMFHLCGHNAFSRLGLYQILVEEIQQRIVVDLQPIECSIHDFNLAEKRPLNLSMIPDKFVKATGLNIRDVKEVCYDLVENAFKYL